MALVGKGCTEKTKTLWLVIINGIRVSVLKPMFLFVHVITVWHWQQI